MLITTQHGVLVNAAHIAFVALSRRGESRPQTPATREERSHKVVLFLAGGDSLVAADRLTYSDAESLRKEIAHRWSEGSALLDVATALERHNESKANTP